MSAPDWAVTPVASAEQAAAITFTKPSGLVDGQVLVVAIRSQGTRSGEITLPSGWSRGGSGTIPNDRAEGIFYKAIPSVAAETATSYTFSSLSTSTSRIIGAIGVLNDADLTHLNDGGIAYDADATLASTAAGGVPYTVIALWGAEFTAGVSVAPSAVPSGFTNVLTAQTAGGSSPSTVLANSNTTGSRTGMVLAAQKIESGSTTVPSLVTTWAGAPTDPKSAVWIVRGKVPVTAKRGFNDVTEMAAKHGATWAHRGGSASYPEHSLYAYQQAALRGYGALELSMQRTSDGVWFGCHDLTLARVTGNAALTQDVRTMTWAQINAYQITIGAQGAPQPFMRWQDFIAAGFGTTHVLILDPKNSVGSYQAEFLAMVAADVNPSRVIMKWAGGLTSFADAASAAGFKTAGFWYQSDFDSNLLVSETTHWDYLGMDITATTAWTGTNNIVALAAAQGKKVWGHIAATQADYNTAMSKGADIVQVSGVAAVSPVSWWTSDVVLPGLTASGTGARTVPTSTGTGAATLPSLTAGGAGASTVPVFTGTAALPLPGLTAAGAGTRTVPVFTGTGDATLPTLQVVGLGSDVPPAYVGTGAAVLPALTGAGAGTVLNPVTGAGAVVLPPLSISGAGSSTVPVFDGAGSVMLPGLTVVGSGAIAAPGRTGVGALVLPSLVAAGVGHVSETPTVTGEGAVVLPALTASATGVIGARSRVHFIITTHTLTARKIRPRPLPPPTWPPA